MRLEMRVRSATRCVRRLTSRQRPGSVLSANIYEVAQLANLLWWYKTGAQLVVLQQFRDTCCVYPIRLMAGQCLDVLWID